MIAVVGAAGTIGRKVVEFLQGWGAPARSLDFRYEGADHVDARDVSSVARALDGAAVCVNCADYRLNLEVMRGALTAGTHYVDLGGLFHMTRRQLELDGDFRAAGLTGILGMGSAPGKTNLLARAAVERLAAEPRRLEIWAATRDPGAAGHPFPAPYSVQTLLDELRMEPMIVADGELQAVEPLSGEAEREARLAPADATAQMRIKVPAQRNRKLRTLLERVNADEGLKAWWHVANVNAVKRLGINDHSWVHIQIVANIGLRFLRLLHKRGVQPAMVADYDMKHEDAEVVVLLGALLHCVGMAVHRDRHEDWSLFLAEPKMRELLDGIYDEPELTVINVEVLQAITSHREYGKPLTLEAGIVRVADALDMEQGRSRIPFERGRVSIHSLSAAAIEDVMIEDGEERPIRIEIVMNNSSGIFQVDEVLKAKLSGSGLEPYVEVVAHIDTEAEKRLVPGYRLET